MTHSLKANRFNFVKLSTIEGLEPDNTPIDVAAYIKDAGETTEVTLKSGNNPKKARRVITLYDNSNTLLEMVSTSARLFTHDFRLCGETFATKIFNLILWSWLKPPESLPLTAKSPFHLHSLPKSSADRI